LLVGRTKIGKSCLLLQIALAVGAGGRALGIPVEQGEVLYLALEDTPRRLKTRIKDQLCGEPAPSGISYFTRWLRWHEGGEAKMAAWLGAHPKARLVIVDTSAKIRAPKRRDEDIYDAAYVMGDALKKIADQFSVTVIAAFHDRKLEAVDWVDMVSGSVGLVAAVDTVMRVARQRGQQDATLQVTGRDVETRELAVRFDKARKLWSILGDAQDLADAAGAPLRTDALLWLRGLLTRASGSLAERVIRAHASAQRPPISKNTLDAAKAAGGIRSFKVGVTWMWALPGIDPRNRRYMGQMGSLEGSQEPQETQDTQHTQDPQESLSFYSKWPVRPEDNTKLVA
jgi:hypothetical protein